MLDFSIELTIQILGAKRNEVIQQLKLVSDDRSIIEFEPRKFKEK